MKVKTSFFLFKKKRKKGWYKKKKKTNKQKTNKKRENKIFHCKFYFDPIFLLDKMSFKAVRDDFMVNGWSAVN